MPRRRRKAERPKKDPPTRHTPLGHVQKEIYWIVALVMFFLERDFITECLTLVLSWVNVMFFK